MQNLKHTHTHAHTQAYRYKEQMNELAVVRGKGQTLGFGEIDEGSQKLKKRQGQENKRKTKELFQIKEF